MTNGRVAALAVGAALLGAWLSSAAGTIAPSPASPPGPLGPAEVPAQHAVPAQPRWDLEREVDRLSARLERVPRPRSPARNPFTFQRQTPQPGAAAAGATAGAPGLAPGLAPAPSIPGIATAPAAMHPPVTLAGIAVERTPDGPRQTAVLSLGGRVFLVRTGDDVAGRYQVRAVTHDTVNLLDLESRDTLRLTLP